MEAVHGVFGSRRRLLQDDSACYLLSDALAKLSRAHCAARPATGSFCSLCSDHASSLQQGDGRRQLRIAFVVVCCDGLIALPLQRRRGTRARPAPTPTSWTPWCSSTRATALRPRRSPRSCPASSAGSCRCGADERLGCRWWQSSQPPHRRLVVPGLEACCMVALGPVQRKMGQHIAQMHSRPFVRQKYLFYSGSHGPAES